MNQPDLASRIRKLEDREAIRELVGAYGYTIDNRDIDALAELFCVDGVLQSADGIMNAQGRAAVVEMYKGRFAVLGPTFHFTHDHAITLDEADANRARGVIASHAEVTRNGETMLAAIRYHDDYRREGGRWRFARRVLNFFYYTPVAEYIDCMKSALRQRAYGDQRPSDWPESLESWQRYKGSAGPR
jgi:ketosteroid isomerase-like protein